MKILYVIVLGLIIGLWSCEDFLTVRPKSDITEEDLFITSEGVEEALFGVYARLGHTDLYGMDMTWGVPDVMAQYFKMSSSVGNERLTISQFMHTSQFARPKYSSMWSSMYEAIGYANNVVNNLLAKDEHSMRYYSIYLGEALGLRAFLHFDLVRLFAPHITRQPNTRGIPYVRKWTAKVNPFSTVKEVYAAVIKDLQESERLLSEGIANLDGGNIFTNKPQIHFNLYAAQATLARVYWMKGDLDSAYIYACKVIDSKKFQLAGQTEIANMMSQIVARKEGIWGVFNDRLTDTYQNNFYGMSEMAILFDPTLYPYAFDELYESGNMVGNDMRYGGWFKAIVSGSQSKDFFIKLLDEENMERAKPKEYKNDIPGINMIRLPEMYLIAAEALLKKDPVKALEYFDTFISSRGLTKFKDRNKVLTLTDIDRERRKEFIGEGQEFYNMKREMRDVELGASNKGQVKGSEELYCLLIPDAEFDYRDDEN